MTSLKKNAKSKCKIEKIFPKNFCWNFYSNLIEKAKKEVIKVNTIFLDLTVSQFLKTSSL